MILLYCISVKGFFKKIEYICCQTNIDVLFYYYTPGYGKCMGIFSQNSGSEPD